MQPCHGAQQSPDLFLMVKRINGITLTCTILTVNTYLNQSVGKLDYINIYIALYFNVFGCENLKISAITSTQIWPVALYLTYSH